MWKYSKIKQCAKLSGILSLLQYHKFDNLFSSVDKFKQKVL